MTTAGCSKRPSSKAAASTEARRTLRYVEPLCDARTPLADFFSILLESLHTIGQEPRLLVLIEHMLGLVPLLVVLQCRQIRFP